MLGLPSFQNEKLFHTYAPVMRGDEGEIVAGYLDALSPFYTANQSQIRDRASRWIEAVRQQKLSPWDVQSLLQAYPLSSAQGRSLMSLAEALLRIPDTLTASHLIQDKISGMGWKNNDAHTLIQLGGQGLDLLSKYFNRKPGLFRKISNPVILKALQLGMSRIANQFILGTTIEKAIARATPDALHRYSYDMLGKARARGKWRLLTRPPIFRLLRR